MEVLELAMLGSRPKFGILRKEDINLRVGPSAIELETPEGWISLDLRDLVWAWLQDGEK
jgi:hypothetical protein